MTRKKLFRLLLLVSLGLLGLGGTAYGWDDHPFGQTIYVVNSSSNLSDSGVASDLPVFAQAANADFAPYWDTAPINFVLQDDVNQLPAHAWVMYLQDSPECLFCAGYHDRSGNNPFAVVGTKAGMNWQIVFSHELFEMLADPYVNRWVDTHVCTPYGCLLTGFYNLEVCDPVPSFGYGYWKDGIRISDFVTPAWFDGQGSNKLDFMGFLHHALRVANHGYLGTYTPDRPIYFH